MTSSPDPLPVVVGIDGSEPAARAMLWAAGEAELRGATLQVVHAGEVPPPREQPEALTSEIEAGVGDPRAYGRQLLADALATLAETHPRVHSTALLRDERPSQVLLDLSESAALVVVGTRGRNRLAGLLLGSTSQRVAGHARCPVVMLSERPVTADPQAPVVAGVSASQAGHAALRLACEEATLRGVEVIAVRSMAETEYMVPGFGYVSFDAAQWQKEQQDLLDRSIALVRPDFPDLTITAKLVGTPAHVALVEESRGAALLVVGCRRPEATYLSRLGPVSSWLMHESLAPIALVGQVHVDETAEGGGPAGPAG